MRREKKKKKGNSRSLSVQTVYKLWEQKSAEIKLKEQLLEVHHKVKWQIQQVDI